MKRTRTVQRRLAAWVAVALVPMAVVVAQTPASIRLHAQVQVVARHLPPWQRVSIAPDGWRVAYWQQRDTCFHVVVDGMPGRQREGEPIPFFSDPIFFSGCMVPPPTGNPTIDGDYHDTNGRVGRVVFSPDGKRLAYPARLGKRCFMVVDGVEGKHYDKVTAPVFSPDSKRLTFTAWEGGRRIAVIDGEELQDDQAHCVVFAPDSRYLVYLASMRKQDRVILQGAGGNHVGRLYDEVSQLTFSPDSQRLAYRARRARRSYHVVVDDGSSKDVVLPEFEWTDWRTSIVFSPDSRRVAWTSELPFDYVRVYLDRKAGDRILCRHNMPTPVFSPDSRRVAWHSDYGLVVDGKLIRDQTYQQVYEPRFSPDSKRLLFRATIRRKQFVVCGDKRYGPYDWIRTVSFSPDSKHVAFWAVCDKKWHVVVDGLRSEAFDRPAALASFDMHRDTLRFDNPRLLRTLAIRGNDVLRVEITLVGR